MARIVLTCDEYGTIRDHDDNVVGDFFAAGADTYEISLDADTIFRLSELELRVY